MRYHNEIWVCPECKAIRTVRRRLVDPKPKCKPCKVGMKKVRRDQSGGEQYR